TFRDDRTLVASRLRLKAEKAEKTREAKLEGRVQQVDSAGHRFTVLGIALQLTPQTKIEGPSTIRLSERRDKESRGGGGERGEITDAPRGEAPPSVPHYGVIWKGRLTRSGEPSQAGWTWLRSQGARAVVNFQVRADTRRPCGPNSSTTCRCRSRTSSRPRRPRPRRSSLSCAIRITGPCTSTAREGSTARGSWLPSYATPSMAGRSTRRWRRRAATPRERTCTRGTSSGSAIGLRSTSPVATLSPGRPVCAHALPPIGFSSSGPHSSKQTPPPAP